MQVSGPLTPLYNNSNLLQLSVNESVLVSLRHRVNKFQDTLSQTIHQITSGPYSAHIPDQTGLAAALQTARSLFDEFNSRAEAIDSTYIEFRRAHNRGGGVSRNESSEESARRAEAEETQFRTLRTTHRSLKKLRQEFLQRIDELVAYADELPCVIRLEYLLMRPPPPPYPGTTGDRTAAAAGQGDRRPPPPPYPGSIRDRAEAAAAGQDDRRPAVNEFLRRPPGRRARAAAAAAAAANPGTSRRARRRARGSGCTPWC